jgi:hypothetical protein
MPEDSNTKYYNLAKQEQAKHRQSEKELDENYKRVMEEERKEEQRQDELNRLHPEDSTVESEFAKGGKVGLWANINRRKRLGISRPKSKSTISTKAYANMKKGFPKKANGGLVSRGQGKAIKIKKTKRY